MTNSTALSDKKSPLASSTKGLELFKAIFIDKDQNNSKGTTVLVRIFINQSLFGLAYSPLKSKNEKLFM